MKRLSGLLICAAVGLQLLVSGCGRNSEENLLASAKAAYDRRDNKSAILDLKSVLQVNPKSGEARLLLGKALLADGDARSAGVELTKAIELRMPEASVLPEYLDALLAQQQFKKVIDEFGSRTVEDPLANARLKTAVATAFLASGEVEKAQSILDNVLQGDPKFTRALFVRSNAKAAVRDYAGAMVVVDQLLALDDKYAEAWKLKGDLHNAISPGAPEAIAAYRKAYEVRSGFYSARLAAISYFLQRREVDEAKHEMAALKKASSANPSMTQFLEAQFALIDADYPRARELIQQLLRNQPDDVRLLQVAGTIELQAGALVQAEKFLSKAMSAQPNNVYARRHLARTYLRMGQPAKSLAILKPLLDRPQPDAEVMATAAEAYLHEGNAKEAEVYFQRAAKVNPDDIRIKTALALTELAKGHVETGFMQLQSIAQSDKGVTADMALISARLRQRDLAGAMKAIDALEGKQPDQPLAANLRGRVQLLRNDTAGARQSFLAALSIKPAYFPAAASLAQMDLLDRKPADAAKRFEDVIKVNPKSAEAYLALADLRQRSGSPKADVGKLISAAVSASPMDPVPRVVLINHHLEARQFKQALLFAQESSSLLPDSVELLAGLGRAQAASGEVNQAMTTYTKLAKLEPKSPYPYLRMADAYLSIKDYDSAVRSYKRALELVPNHVEAQRGLISIALRQGKPELALKSAAELQRQAPDDPTGYLFEADIYAESKNFDAAIAAYRTALKKVKSANQVAIKLHAALGASGRHAEAASFAAGWLRDYPKDAAFRYYLGDFFMAKRDYPAAEKKYEEVIAIQPDNAWALNNLAWLLVQQKKKGAVEYASRAVALVPDKAAVLDTLALALAGDGDLPKAIEMSEKAVAMSPDLPDLRLNLAKIYLKAGKKVEAATELDRLAALGAKFPRQPEVQALSKLAGRG